MRKSRFLALLLTVVFVLANVTIPSFADTTYTYGDPADIIGLGNPVAPLAGMPFHISYAVDGDAEYALSSNVDGITLSDDGILSIGHDVVACNSAGNTKSVNLSVSTTTSDGTVVSPKIGSIYSSFNFTFDDGKLPAVDGYFPSGNTDRVIASGLAIASDASGRIYGALVKNYTSMYGQTLLFNRSGASSPLVIEMDINSLSEYKLYNAAHFGQYLIGLTKSKNLDQNWLDWVVTSGGTINPNFDIANFSTDGWHNYKWLITPNAKVVGDTTVPASFDLYIDDVNLAKNVTIVVGTKGSMQTGNSSNYHYRLYHSGIDNFKRYATSLGFAHDVAISAPSNKAGSTLTASAQKATMPMYNIPESLEYAFYVGDQIDGDFEIIPSTIGSATFVPGEEYAGKVIKAAARVKEAPIHDDPCTSEWVISKNSIVVEPSYSYAYGDPSLSFPTNATIVAPMAGLPLRLAHTVKGGPATYAFNKTITGISVSDNGILNITDEIGSFKGNVDAVTVGGNVTTTLYGGETNVGPTISTIKTSYDFGFDDGILPADAFVGAANRPVLNGIAITSDASGRVYAKHSKNNYISMMAQQAFMSNSKAVLPFVFEFEASELSSSINVSTYATLLGISDYELSQSWIDESVNSGAVLNPDFEIEKYAPMSWNSYKWVMTPNAYTANGVLINPHFDIYINGVLLMKNVPIKDAELEGKGWYQSGSASNYTVRFYAKKVDNIRRYGTSLGFAHDVKLVGDARIGSTLTVSADKATMPLYNIPETLEYAFFACDTANGTYEKIADGQTFVADASVAGKYIKAAARVKEDIAGGVATDWVLSGYATFVSDVAISSISLSIDGVDCDFDDVNLAGKESAEIAITISAAAAKDINAKFVLAQYAKVNGKNVLVGAALANASLTADAQDFTLDLNASGINNDTEFKLFMIDVTSGNVPLGSPIVVK